MVMRSSLALRHRGAAVRATLPPQIASAVFRCATTRYPAQLPTALAGEYAVLVPSSALRAQRRFQYAQMPGKRDQEAFLTQFEPLEVLGLESDCSVEDIDAAFEKAKAKFGPKGPYPDAKMVDRVFRAHEILKDPNSPYYLKAHSSQTDRQRLQFQLLPKSKRRFVEFQVCLLMLIVFGVMVLVVKLVLRPMNHSIRAATR